MKVTVRPGAAHKRDVSRVIGRTRSVCPHCLEVIDALYVSRGDEVYMDKACARHGAFSTPVWTGADEFAALVRAGAGQPCPATPRDCTVCAAHPQKTCCVLLEVTGRCSLSCPVCFADAEPGGPEADPPLSDIGGWFDVLMARGGPFNIQLSGGEPTMRDDLPEIIRLGREKGFSFFQLNTNGLRLAEEPGYADALAEAGLNTVFLQFDGVSDEVYKKIRGRPLFRQKCAAIENCGRAGLGVVLVPTVVAGVNDAEAGAVLAFGKSRMPHVRGVHFQPVSFFGRHHGADAAHGRITIPRLLDAIERQSAGEIKKSDFSPANAEHPLCSFHADYLVENDRFCLVKSSSSSGCCSVTSDQSRRVVARKWSAPKPPPEDVTSPSQEGHQTDAFDMFLRQRAEQEKKRFAVSGMAFQDAWNLDLDRLGRCYISELSPDGALIPFCAYNLSRADGPGLYRK